MAPTKRYTNVSGSDFSSDEEDLEMEMDGKLDGTTSSKTRQVLTSKMNVYKNGKRPKCQSRNALMARENRLKKKMYIQDLEARVTKLRDTNKKLNSIIENQSFVIHAIRKELKYLRGVLANSADLCNLIKNIQRNTGMCVKTTLDHSLTDTTDYVSKRKEATLNVDSWQREELSRDTCTPSPLTHALSPLSDLSELNFDLDDNLIMDDVLLSNSTVDEQCSDRPAAETLPTSTTTTLDDPIKEHNYTNNVFGDYNSADHTEDVGICLHVSKHRVSLEFCSTCNENAVETWK